MSNKNKFFIFGLIFPILFMFLIFNNTLISAQSAQHGINGYVFDGPGNISANGASVTFWLYYSNGTTLKNPVQLHDTVGPSGLSGLSNWYSQDANNFKNPYWSAGDIVIIQIIKDSNRSINTTVTLSSIGNNQAPTVTLPGFCGDVFCSTGENCSTCAEDCLICGDGSCSIECGENATTCVQDCPIVCSYCGNGACDSSRNETSNNCIVDCHCGNDICELDEDYDFCPEDCPFAICGNGLCDSGENLINCQDDCGGQECNNNLICDFGESYLTCPLDCLQITCGNAVCEENETEENCPSDCQPIVCGDNLCEEDNGEDYINCPIDCYKAIAKCGDKKCEYAENKNNCCADCGCDIGKECIKNTCSGKSCCFLGICFSIFGICGYWLILGLLLIVVIIIIYSKSKKR